MLQKDMYAEEYRGTNMSAKFEEIPNGLKSVCKCHIFDTLFRKYAYCDNIQLMV